MDQKNGRSQKTHKSKKSVFSCLSTTRRNFWNSFILRPYFQSCFPKLQMAHTVPFLQIFCQKLAQWLLRIYYILKWVSAAEFPFSGLRLYNRVAPLLKLDFGRHTGHRQKPYEQLSSNNLWSPSLSYFETSDWISSTILLDFRRHVWSSFAGTLL